MSCLPTSLNQLTPTKTSNNYYSPTRDISALFKTIFKLMSCLLPLTHAQNLEPTVKTSFHSEYHYSQLGLNPNLDLKTIAINEHTLAFQSIESEVRKGSAYINMRVSFVNISSGNIQTITFPTGERLRIDNGLLPKPVIFPNGNYGVAWRKQAGWGLSIVEQKNQTWAIKCSNIFEDVLPQTSQPLLLGHINGSFTLLTGHDDYNYDSVFFRFFNSECVQIGSEKELSTPRVNLVEFYAKKINEETAILSVHHGDGNSETIKFESKTGKILSKRSDSDSPMSEPIEMEQGIFSSLKKQGQEFITININTNNPTLERNSKASDLQFKDPVDRAFGFLRGPNNTFLAMQYSEQQLFGTLTDQTSQTYGLPFTISHVPERPTVGPEAVVLLPIDSISLNGLNILTLYHQDRVELLKTELTQGQIDAPTIMPTTQPSTPSLRAGESNNADSSLLIIILVTILGSIGGLGILLLLYRHSSQNERGNNQKESSNNYEMVHVTPSAPPLDLPIAYPIIEATNAQLEKQI